MSGFGLISKRHLSIKLPWFISTSIKDLSLVRPLRLGRFENIILGAEGAANDDRISVGSLLIGVKFTLMALIQRLVSEWSCIA